MFHARTTTARRASTMSIGAALLLAAFGGVLSNPLDANAKVAPSAPIKALAATNLKEAGGSRIAIRLSKPAPKKLKVLVKTSAAPGANAATAKQDFAAKLQWVTIAKGSKIGYLKPSIVADSLDEANERFRVQLVKTTAGAKLPAAAKHRSAFATILDDDAPAPTPDPIPAPVPPTVSVNDAHAKIIEGDVDNATARFKVTLSAASTTPVAVPYTLTDGSAQAGLDFAATAPGVLNFAPGTTELTVDVPVLDDNIDEDTETAAFALGTPTGATIANGAGELAVFDDEGAPKMAMSNVSTEEGDAGSKYFPFMIGLTHPSAKVITVTTFSVETSANAGVNCALLGVDYVVLAPKVITFQPGETVKQVDVKVCGDDDVENDEFFALALTEITNATTSNPNGIGKIENDD